MKRLRLWRMERGLSQIELGEAAGVPRHVIQLAEGQDKVPREQHLTRLIETPGYFGRRSCGWANHEHEKGRKK